MRPERQQSAPNPSPSLYGWSTRLYLLSIVNTNSLKSIFSPLSTFVLKSWYTLGSGGHPSHIPVHQDRLFCRKPLYLGNRDRARVRFCALLFEDSRTRKKPAFLVFPLQSGRKPALSHEAVIGMPLGNMQHQSQSPDVSALRILCAKQIWSEGFESRDEWVCFGRNYKGDVQGKPVFSHILSLGLIKSQGLQRLVNRAKQKRALRKEAKMYHPSRYLDPVTCNPTKSPQQSYMPTPTTFHPNPQTSPLPHPPPCPSSTTPSKSSSS